MRVVNGGRSGFMALLYWAVTALVLLMGAFLAYNGSRLVYDGGSWYYLLSGLTLLASAALMFKKGAAGGWLVLVWVVATIAWSLFEAGTNFWMLFPRVFVPVAVGLLVSIAMQASFPLGQRGRRILIGLAAAQFVVAAVLLANLFARHGQFGTAEGKAPGAGTVSATDTNWTQYAGSGRRNAYVDLDQINVNSVSGLKVAWTMQTGDLAEKGAEDQNTPLEVDGTLYACTPFSKVIAIDGDTGARKWTFDPKAESPVWQRCRSVAYADLSKNTFNPGSTPNACPKRVMLGTIDARLIAINAETGERCSDFGTDGQVDLKEGMGQIDPGFYMQTSGPTVIENGLVVIAGWVLDNDSVGEPSGVVRAFDAQTGKLVWAWDLGNKQITQEPPPGSTYTRGTPNMWAFAAVDEDLGMVYLPLGNATPDYWGGHRTKAADEYNSSVVALDYRTGKEKWKFRTVNHDIWDYDLPTHPILYDIPDGKGGTSPGLIQLTKRGEIFVLDRRNGKPLAEVKEKRVPIDRVAEGDYVSATQPYSVGMPSIRGPKLDETQMWGMTMFDQLLCRIEFHKYRYQGDFTPQSVEGILQSPSNLGGMNWGGGAIDPKSGYLLVNDSRIIMAPRLIPREQAEHYAKQDSDGHLGFSPQNGTPYGITTGYFLSPLGVPCNSPPLGTLSAIDLVSKKVVWQVPLGTTRDSGPMGIKTGVPMQVGMPSLGGPLATAGGLTFYSGTQDYYLRAMDTLTGREVWKGRLPVGGQSTPMSYRSPKTGKQYIVVNASGARGQPERGDYIIAFALDSDTKLP